MQLLLVFFGVFHKHRVVNNNGAISLCRSSNVNLRKRYVKLVESAKENGCEVKIFSSMHVSGESLSQLSGIAAVLRFPCPRSKMKRKS